MDEKITEEDGLKKESKLKKISIAKSLSALLVKISSIILIVILVFNFIFGFVKVSDNGMFPALKPADLVLVDRLNKKFAPKDLVAIKIDGKTIVARIVAVGGDTVDIGSEGLLVNGVLQVGEYKQEIFLYKGGFKGPVKLSKDEIFVLGDNPKESLDSRMFGPIKIDKTMGKVMFFLRRRNF